MGASTMLEAIEESAEESGEMLHNGPASSYCMVFDYYSVPDDHKSIMSDADKDKMKLMEGMFFFVLLFSHTEVPPSDSLQTGASSGALDSFMCKSCHCTLSKLVASRSPRWTEYYISCGPCGRRLHRHSMQSATTGTSIFGAAGGGRKTSCSCAEPSSPDVYVTYRDERSGGGGGGGGGKEVVRCARCFTRCANCSAAERPSLKKPKTVVSRLKAVLTYNPHFPSA